MHEVDVEYRTSKLLVGNIHASGTCTEIRLDKLIEFLSFSNWWIESKKIENQLLFEIVILDFC